jgi:hypothetical protein
MVSDNGRGFGASAAGCCGARSGAIAAGIEPVISGVRETACASAASALWRASIMRWMRERSESCCSIFS